MHLFWCWHVLEGRKYQTSIFWDCKGIWSWLEQNKKCHPARQEIVVMRQIIRGDFPWHASADERLLQAKKAEVRTFTCPAVQWKIYLKFDCTMSIVPDTCKLFDVFSRLFLLGKCTDLTYLDSLFYKSCLHDYREAYWNFDSFYRKIRCQWGSFGWFLWHWYSHNWIGQTIFSVVVGINRNCRRSEVETLEFQMHVCPLVMKS